MSFTNLGGKLLFAISNAHPRHANAKVVNQKWPSIMVVVVRKEESRKMSLKILNKFIFQWLLPTITLIEIQGRLPNTINICIIPYLTIE